MAPFPGEKAAETGGQKRGIISLGGGEKSQSSHLGKKLEQNDQAYEGGETPRV